jgi:hypothetical protein
VPSNVAAAPTPPRCKPAAASEPLHELPTEEFELIVVDGGHAGSEVALTTARLGIRTALFSISLDRVAWQPCNPAVAGPAKSQLVLKVDALRRLLPTGRLPVFPGKRHP